MINFLRYIKIVVNGIALDSDQFNIEFEVDRSSSSSANGAKIKFLHINDNTYNLFKIDHEIQIMAGYKKGIVGLIFLGVVDEVEKKLDSLTILATESNDKIKNTVVNQSFTPNTRQGDVVKKIIEGTGFEVGEMFINSKDDFQLYRGAYFTESLEESLNKMASKTNCIWYVKKGLIYFHPKNYNSEKVFINADSGLMEFNKKNDDEYVIVSKLNHSLDENKRVTVEYEIGKKVDVFITSASHYSSEFITECEVEIIEWENYKINKKWYIWIYTH